MRIKFLPVFAIVLFTAHLSTSAQIASGGPYVLQQTVIAGGGGEAVAGSYAVEMTQGQAIAGTTSQGGAYSVMGGFWARSPLGPTSANASIRGRVVRKGGSGLSNVILTLSGGPLTSPYTAVTRSFGYFKIESIPVGYFYILTVRHKRYSFAPDTYAFSLYDEINNIEFQAEELP